MNSKITSIVVTYSDYIEFDVNHIDMGQVKDYGIKWGTLYLVMKDGSTMHIEGEQVEGDYKWPIEENFYDKEHYPIERDEEE
mgnify:CR=1 FL=1